MAAAINVIEIPGEVSGTTPSASNSEGTSTKEPKEPKGGWLEPNPSPPPRSSALSFLRLSARSADPTGNKDKGAVDLSKLKPELRALIEKYDHDGSGSVNVHELAAAIEAMKEEQEENRLFKKLLFLGLLCILLLVGSVFAVSIAAAELTKQVEVVGDDPALRAVNGEVVQVSSSDFMIKEDGSLCAREAHGSGRRLTGDSSGVLGTKDVETPRRLSSTMGMDAYKELKYITLKDTNNDLALVVKVEGVRRERVHTSACGSVVKLETPHGQVSVDDFDVLIDEEFRNYTISAGLGNLLQGSGLQALGRRLTGASMLTGFFNALPEGEYQCESQPLEAPEELNGTFIAHVKIRQKMDPANSMMSHLFPKEDGDLPGLLKPGVEQEGDSYFKVWYEESIGGAMGSKAKLQRFPTYPMTDFFSVKLDDDSYTAMMAIEDGVVANCTAAGNPTSYVDEEMMRRLSDQDLVQQPENPRVFEFIDLVEMDGLILRHFRLDLLALYEKQTGMSRDYNPSLLNSSRAKGSDKLNVLLMMQHGMAPNMYDYYDVDTDPLGVREPGSPYRKVSWSTVPSSAIYTEATYISVERASDGSAISDLLARRGVSSLSVGCVSNLKLDFNDTANVFIPEIVFDLRQSLQNMTSVHRPRPKINYPPIESGPHIQRQRELLLSFDGVTTESEDRLAWALQFPYWQFILWHPEVAGDVLDKFSGSYSDDDDVAMNDTEIGGAQNSSRRAGQLGSDSRTFEEVDEDVDNFDGRKLSSCRRRNCHRRRASRKKCDDENNAAKAKKPCFGFDLSGESISFSMNVPYKKGGKMQQFAISLNIEFPGYRFGAIALSAVGEDVPIGCFFKLCAFASGGGDISFTQENTGASHVPTESAADMSVWVQPKVGTLAGPLIPGPKLTIGMKFEDKDVDGKMDLIQIYQSTELGLSLKDLVKDMGEVAEFLDLLGLHISGSAKISHIFEPGGGSCTPFDNRDCLAQSPGFNSGHTCPHVVKRGWCHDHKKTTYRCCSKSCGVEYLTQSACSGIGSSGQRGGDCIYPHPGSSNPGCGRASVDYRKWTYTLQVLHSFKVTIPFVVSKCGYWWGVRVCWVEPGTKSLIDDVDKETILGTASFGF